MFDNIINSFKEYMIAKEERKKVESQRKQALEKYEYNIKIEKLKIEAKLLSEGKKIPENLDKLAMEQMDKSWKDEFILLILFLPIALAFIPDIQNVISAGFTILETHLPDWYMYLVVGIVIVTYGMRGILKILLSNNIKTPNINVIKSESTENKEDKKNDAG